jgi:oxysterol-binding protein-related protein 9/10/11
LKFSPYVTITENTVITRRYRPSSSDLSGPAPSRSNKQLRAVLNYIEESWIGKPRYWVKGYVFECNENDPEDLFKDGSLKETDERVRAKFEGTWKGLIKWRRVQRGGILGVGTNLFITWWTRINRAF